LYVMGLSEEVAGEGEKMLGNEKYWNILSIFEYNIM
jgi:hypothetical protein